MSTPVKNSLINMFESGYIQLEIAGILSLSQFALQSFSNDLRRSDLVKINIEANVPEKPMSVVIERYLRCVKLDRRQTVSNKADIVHLKLPSFISSRTARRRLKYLNFAGWKTGKLLTLRSVNRTHRVNRCRGK